MPLDPNDWRLDFVRGYEGYSWTLKPYRAPRADWDHDHCVACGQKLMQQHHDGQAETEGYAVGPEHPHGADYEWLCIGCAQQLAAQMNWNLRGGLPAT